MKWFRQRSNLSLRLARWLLVLWGATIWACPAPAAVPAPAVVTVVGLDAEGTPQRHGMGVILENGLVLCSISILGADGLAVIKTADGALHLSKPPLWQDFLQGLCLLEVEGLAVSSPLQPAQGKWRPLLKVGLAVLTGKGPSLTEGTITGVLALSPRITLLKITSGDIQIMDGTPVFSGDGRLLGMYHDFADLRLCLALNSQDLPKKIQRREAGTSITATAPTPLPPEVYQAFWEGVAASLREDWSKAGEHFDAALKNEAVLPEAALGRGVARQHLKDNIGAILDCQKALKWEPGYALAYFWLGRAQEESGLLTEAATAYHRAKELAPDMREPWLHLGLLAYRGGKLATAKEFLQQVPDDFPQALEKWWRLGQIYLTEQRWEEAQEAFGHALSLRPNYLPALVERGKLLVKLGRPEEAIPLLEQAVAQQPQQTHIRYHLALAYHFSWRQAAAWEEYWKLRRQHSALAPRLAALLENQH
ncbi:MAG TPA: hypothetical protein DCY27_08270 [Desulfobacterales bacterium]|nr:hypothetical protein [Desulfobacterales bacterium]